MKRLLSLLLLLVAMPAFGQASKSWFTLNPMSDGTVVVDSVSFPTSTATTAKVGSGQRYRDTLTANGVDTSSAFQIAGVEGLAVTFQPVYMAIGTNMTITPRISDDGLRWTNLATFTLAISAVSYANAASVDYAGPSSFARQVFLAPNLSDDDSLGQSYLSMTNAKRIRMANYMQFIIDLNFHGSTDTTVAMLTVNKRYPKR